MKKSLRIWKRLMKEAEEYNEKYKAIVREGYVLHCYDDSTGEYAMFKVKPYDIMKHDVLQTYGIPKDRIELEISKLLLESTAYELAKDFPDSFETLLGFLEEDYKITNKEKKKALDVFVGKIAKQLKEEIGCRDPKELVQEGVNPVFMKAYRIACNM